MNKFLMNQPSSSVAVLPFLTACLAAEAATPPRPIIDSNLSSAEAMSGNQCSNDALFNEVKARQELLTVLYWGMDFEGNPDGLVHQGQIVVDSKRAEDVSEIFQVAYDARFPIHSVIPVSQFNWIDADSMKANNTSGWNYRSVGSSKSCPKRDSSGQVSGSKHASLQSGTVAIDINDVQNPYCHSNGSCEPDGAKYNRNAPGTLTSNHPIVKVASAQRGSTVTVSLCTGNEWKCSPTSQTRSGLGWTWGGTWSAPDYQHLQVGK